MRSGTSSGNLFNLELKYNNPSAGTANYNGNISQMGYSYATGTPVSRTFTYTYDYLNRLTDAALASGTSLKETLSYDDLGNITSLARGGTGHGTLSYGYTNGRLTGVTGYAARSYAYDRNGNATSDGGSKMIGYNMLNLPDTVKVSNAVILKYYYDAAGQKLRSVSTADGTREYIGGIIYEGSDLRSISTAEGRITHNSGVFKYKYDLKDHLGNVRVTFDKNTSTGNAEIVQADEYYSFGLRSSLHFLSPENRYLYNGKEEQVDLEDQYDYGARFYDPVIARWTSVDPSAENDAAYSPYIYGFNNSIRFTDPDGRWPDGPGDDFVEGVKEGFTGYFTGIAHAVMNPGETIKNTFSAEGFKTAALDGATLGGYSYFKTAINLSNAAANGDYKTLGNAVGNKAAEATAVLATEGAVKGFTAVKSLAKDASKIEITEAYKRPTNATTAEQRASVQNKPCATCGTSGNKMVADHKTPLVKEYYKTGKIDKVKMRSKSAVQPQCPTCSTKQGAEMSKYSKEQKKLNGL